MFFDQILNDFISLYKFDLKDSLVIILGEGKSLKISRFCYNYEKTTNEKVFWISVDPIFRNWSGSKVNKKMKRALIGEEAEYLKIRKVLLDLELINQIKNILLVSINAHTHAGKFLDRLIKTSLNIYGEINIWALCSKCHFRGLYKKQIKDTLKYPEIRRTNPSEHRGWLMNVDVYWSTK